MVSFETSLMLINLDHHFFIRMCRYLYRLGRDLRSPGTGSCELSDVDTGDRTWILLENHKYSTPLDHFSCFHFFKRETLGVWLTFHLLHSGKCGENGHFASIAFHPMYTIVQSFLFQSRFKVLVIKLFVFPIKLITICTIGNWFGSSTGAVHNHNIQAISLAFCLLF